MRCLAFFIFISLLAMSPNAPAQSVKDAAKKHRDAGSAAFEIAQYDRAIEEFKLSYELDPDPRVFYNLGLAHLKRHELAPSRADLVQARDYFKRFLAFVRDDAQVHQLRELAAGYVARIESELAKPSEPLPAKIVEVQIAPPYINHTTSYVIMGASAAMAVIAVVTGILAVRASNDAFAAAYDGDIFAADASSGRARNFALATDVLLVGGILAGASGIVLYFVETP